MARQVRGDAEPIPAPGVPGVQNVVNQPEANYPEPGTGPKQPGFTLSHTQNLGESNEEFAERAQKAEDEAREQRSQAQAETDEGESEEGDGS